jgi:hypothetical protein
MFWVERFRANPPVIQSSSTERRNMYLQSRAGWAAIPPSTRTISHLVGPSCEQRYHLTKPSSRESVCVFDECPFKRGQIILRQLKHKSPTPQETYGDFYFERLKSVTFPGAWYDITAYCAGGNLPIKLVNQWPSLWDCTSEAWQEVFLNPTTLVALNYGSRLCELV